MLKRLAAALGEAGALRSAALLASEDKDTGRKPRYRYTRDNKTLLVSVVIDRSGQFTDFRFGPE